MKREDITAIGIEDKDQLDKIMSLHGKSVETHKQAKTTLETSNAELKAQLETANKTIEDFKGMDIEGIKKSAEEYKSKLESAQSESEAKIKGLQLDYAVGNALKEAKARNPKIVESLIQKDKLVLDGDKALGLSEQLEALKTSDIYLFESDDTQNKTQELTKPMFSNGTNQPKDIETDDFLRGLKGD